jgi:hypothetical protein
MTYYSDEAFPALSDEQWVRLQAYGSAQEVESGALLWGAGEATYSAAVGDVLARASRLMQDPCFRWDSRASSSGGPIWQARRSWNWGSVIRHHHYRRSHRR